MWDYMDGDAVSVTRNRSKSILTDCACTNGQYTKRVLCNFLGVDEYAFVLVA